METKQKDIIFKILRWGGLVILLGLILVVASGFVEKTTDADTHYEWRGENSAEKYKDVVWKKIIKERLNGFTSLGNDVAENKIACYWSDEPCHSLISKGDEYLRVEGGLMSVYYFLEITKNGENLTIKSLAGLKKFFAPVDNEIKAMSFIGVTETDLKKNKGDVLVGETAIIDDGYLVKVVKNRTFGCGRHDPQKVIFKITRAGEIMMTAIEILPPPSEYDFGTCVD